MLDLVQTVPARSRAREHSTITVDPAFGRSLDRLFRAAVALYLLPLFLAVFAVGTLGTLVVAVSERFFGTVSRQASVPRNPRSLEIFRG
jgi:hypothetical protein